MNLNSTNKWGCGKRVSLKMSRKSSKLNCWKCAHSLVWIFNCTICGHRWKKEKKKRLTTSFYFNLHTTWALNMAAQQHGHTKKHILHFAKQQESVYCDRITVPNFHLKSPKRTKIVFQVCFAGIRANDEWWTANVKKKKRKKKICLFLFSKIVLDTTHYVNV